MVKAQQRQPATIAESRNAPHSPSPAQSVFIHGFSPRSDSPPQPAPTLRPPPRPAPTLLRRAAGSRSAGGTPAPPPRRRPPQRRPSTDAASRSTTLHLVHAAVRLAPPLIHDADLLTLPSASHRRREGHFLHAAVSSPRRTSSAPPRRRPSRASQVGATVVARRPDAALAVAAAGARPLVSSTARRAAAQLSFAAYSAAGGDIEDSPVPGRSLLARFRERRALAITDITATEWCEKQMEFVPEHSKPERNEAMRAGSERHVQLEQEVVERVEVTIRSAEELWAVKFMDFMMGTNQLMFEGITREIPVIGVVEGSWMIGIIDEIRMPIDGISFQPILVDSKTRVRPTIPSEAQKRNGSMQLKGKDIMAY
ncbi:exonuclease V, chloroplastic-like [Panicum miliaceum]|uniref:Exonuclease V, chloroplastic-like n=1 Tax=Panicum miliaceum TaxID=4540 RepID=A0A3L6PT80_PANMI|nr:exonuclease V, chloroplastic-like [Panicum miliaceum]